METPRSLDLDGLDGIMPSSDKRQSKYAGLKVIWAALFIGLAAIILFFTLNQRHSPLTSPEKPTQPTESLPAEAAKILPETVSAKPAGKVDRVAPIATNTTSMPATESSASTNPLQAQRASATQPPAEFILPAEPAAAGSATDTAGTALFTVYFKLKSSTPIRLSEAEIPHLIDLAKRCPKRIRITGHTCNLGSVEGNQRLGRLRADAVKKLLMANGISAPQIEIASEGENQPATSNDTSFGRASNRRAVLSCLDQ